MLALILFVAGVALGAVVARWWLVPLPLIVAAAYVVVLAAVGGEDREGMPVWQLAAVFGAVWGAAGMLGLILGVGWGGWARDRRSERSQPLSRWRQ